MSPSTCRFLGVDVYRAASLSLACFSGGVTGVSSRLLLYRQRSLTLRLFHSLTRFPFDSHLTFGLFASLLLHGLAGLRFGFARALGNLCGLTFRQPYLTGGAHSLPSRL